MQRVLQDFPGGLPDFLDAHPYDFAYVLDPDYERGMYHFYQDPGDGLITPVQILDVDYGERTVIFRFLGETRRRQTRRRNILCSNPSEHTLLAAMDDVFTVPLPSRSTEDPPPENPAADQEQPEAQNQEPPDEPLAPISPEELEPLRDGDKGRRIPPPLEEEPPPDQPPQEPPQE